jgi:hypothetical protein
MTADALKDLLNDLLRDSTETYWRINHHHKEAFLTHTINNSKVYYWPESGEVKTHSKLANEFMREKLQREPDRIDSNGNSNVHVWVVRSRIK